MEAVLLRKTAIYFNVFERGLEQFQLGKLRKKGKTSVTGGTEAVLRLVVPFFE